MTNDRTPLQQIQDEAAFSLLPRPCPPHLREALDAYLVQAFDAGSRAVRELDTEAARTN